MSLRPTATVLAVGMLLLAACSDSKSGGSATTAAGSSTTTSVAAGTTSTVVASTTTMAPTTTAAPTTLAPSTTAAAPPTTSGGSGCPGASGIPAGAAVGATIHGDIDGDTLADTVTEYSLAGVPHVHAQLATGGQSDAEVPVGFADHVSISFEDFDHSLGAATPPPVAVLAVGPTKAGTAQFTFLTLTTHYCIQPWHVSGGSMFVGRISAEPIYEGLMCDGAMGHIYYSLTSAEPAGAGTYTVSTRLLHHNFTLVTIDPPQTSTVSGTDAEIQDQYGDFANCGHPPMF